MLLSLLVLCPQLALAATPLAFVNLHQPFLATKLDELEGTAVDFPSRQAAALNLHDGPEESVSSPSKPIAANCTTRGLEFEKTLMQKRSITVQCAAGCDDADEASGMWDVFGSGPFRLDSCVCKAAFIAGVIGRGGGEV
jgi:hypothetical protein